MISSGSAPVAIFAYNRPDHLQDTLNSLLECHRVDLAPITVFIDGPGQNVDPSITEQVRYVASNLLGSSADIRVASRNQGLASSITSGVRQLIEKHGRVIVVEDDLRLAAPFLEFMNDALDRYQSDDDVYQISGHMFDVPEFAHRKEAIFLPFTTTWGWATWGRAWKAFDASAAGWERLRQDKQLRRRFDLDGAYPYTWLMERQQRRRSDSWGIRWYWSVFQRNGLSIFPPRSLVCNTGQDGSGTHGGGVLSNFDSAVRLGPPICPELPDHVAVIDYDYAAVRRSIWRQNGAWKGWALQKMRWQMGL